MGFLILSQNYYLTFPAFHLTDLVILLTPVDGSGRLPPVAPRHDDLGGSVASTGAGRHLPAPLSLSLLFGCFPPSKTKTTSRGRRVGKQSGVRPPLPIKVAIFDDTVLMSPIYAVLNVFIVIL